MFSFSKVEIGKFFRKTLNNMNKFWFKMKPD